MTDNEKLAQLIKLTAGVDRKTIEAVTKGVEESIIEVDGEFYGDIESLVNDSVKNGELEVDLLHPVEDYEVWIEEDAQGLVECINEGASDHTKTKSGAETGFTEETPLIDFVIYALEVSL